MFQNDPAYEKFTRLQQENKNHQTFLAECHLLHMIVLLLFKQKSICLYHLVVKQTLNSALQRAFKAFQQCLLDN